MFKQKKYIGIDIRDCVKDHLKNINWAEFYIEDLIKLNQKSINLKSIQADKVISFEVIEHVGKQNVFKFLKNFKDCGNKNAIYYLSTPNYDEKVGAAGNHTYDSDDGRGIDIQEFSHDELYSFIRRAGFKIIKKFGTFASQKDYKSLLNDWQLKMFNELKEYYDSNLVSNIMAPFFPEQSRNTLWVLKNEEI